MQVKDIPPQRAEHSWIRDEIRDPIGAYRIGNDHHQITERDIVVLGVIFVSKGAITPLLQLREGFGR